MSDSDEDYPRVECPKCGVEQTDMDGFGVLYCDACGYCKHPSYTGDKCDICGAQFVSLAIPAAAKDGKA